MSHPKVFGEADNESPDGGTPWVLRGPFPGPRPRDPTGCLRPLSPVPCFSDATRHDFARDPLSRLVERPANFWASRIARRADLVLAAESAPDWPNVRRIGPIVRGFSASREKLREDFVFRKKTILVTVGGTAVGEFLIREAVHAFHELKLDDVSMVVVSGPKLKADPESGVYTYGFL